MRHHVQNSMVDVNSSAGLIWLTPQINLPAILSVVCSRPQKRNHGLEGRMAYGCMDRLKGKWALSREPFQRGKLQDLHLSSDANGKVDGSATLTIDGNAVKLQVSGLYNGGAIEMKVSNIDETIGFGFEGNCEGTNLFKGAMFAEEFTGEAQLRYLG